MKCYQTAEKLSTITTKLFTILLSGTIIMIFSTFLQTVLEVYVRNKDMNENYLLPVTCTLPFEVNNWFRYYFAFIWTYSNFLTIALSKILISSIQFTFCFYTIAVMKHQQIMTKDFENIKLVSIQLS